MTLALVQATASHLSAQPHACFAANLIKASQQLLPKLEAGAQIDARALRCAMEDAFGATDAQGGWNWKDAYEAVECAQLLFVLKFGAAMERSAKEPQQLLTMIERLFALVPSHTRRSEDSQKLQQFSTPLPLAFVAAKAAGLTDADTVLEQMKNSAHDVAGDIWNAFTESGEWVGSSKSIVEIP